MKYRAVVFDLDGTLLDTLDDIVSSVNACLVQFGLPVRTKEEIRSFIGNGARKLLERASDGKAPMEQLFPAYKAYYSAHCADTTKPFKGVMETLAVLKERGIKIGVLSNKPHHDTKPMTERFFGDLVDLAQGEDEEQGVMRKPNPASLFVVMQKLGVDKSQTVYVGDSEVDIQTARNAGVDCISLTWGFKEREVLEEYGATMLADDAEQLLKFLSVKE